MGVIPCARRGGIEAGFRRIPGTRSGTFAGQIDSLASSVMTCAKVTSEVVRARNCPNRRAQVLSEFRSTTASEFRASQVPAQTGEEVRPTDPPQGRINSTIPIAAKDSATSWVTSESVSAARAKPSINSVVMALSAQRGEYPVGRCSRSHSPVVPCLRQSRPVIVRRRNDCWLCASNMRTEMVLDTI